MARTRTSDPFQTISADELATVGGGRLIPSKGPDPAVLQGIQQLAQTIAEVGQLLAAQQQQSSAQMMQLMQRMMQARGGR
jgi:hypothetical protein